MNPRPIVHLIRDEKLAGAMGTFGDLVFGDFKCKTLERPPTGDHPCIPGNVLGYDVDWTTHHPHHNPCYEVMRVFGRTDILIHSANIMEQLQGCIALGRTREIVTVPWGGKTVSHVGITSSRATVAAFVEKMQRQNFKLIIKEA